MTVRHALGRIESAWRCHVRVLLLFIRAAMASLSVLSVSGVLRSDVEAILKYILSCFELSQVAR